MEEKEIKRTQDKEPEERQTGKDDIYAYEIKDRSFGVFKVLNTANGWWLDRAKVENLIGAYKIDCTDEEACTYAGISLDQLKYFKELHKEFYNIKSTCKQFPILKARKTIVDSLENTEDAKWYLERKKKNEFSIKSEIEHSGEVKQILTEEQINELIRRKANNTGGEV
jgi:hypothetical protein